MEIDHFVTKWFFDTPIEKVWKEILDIHSWPTWWLDFKRATIRGSEPVLVLGSMTDCEVKGSAIYTMRFLLQVPDFQPPNLLEFESSGDLAGSGRFVLESRDSGTECTFYWDVGTTNWLFNLLGKLPFVRAWMERNHNRVMANGYQKLRAKLESLPVRKLRRRS